MSSPTIRVTDAPMTFRAQLAALWRYRNLILLGVVIGIIGALAMALLPGPRYSATADVLVRVASSTPFQSGDVTKQISMQTEIEVAESERVAQGVIKARQLSTAAKDLSRNLRVTNPPDTLILRFSYADGDPLYAAGMANDFAEAYLADRKARTARILDDQIKVFTDEKATLEARLAGLDKQLAGDDAGTALQTRRDLVANQLTELEGRLLDSKIVDTTPGDVVRAASPPSFPDGPSLVTMVVLGAMVGLVLGVALAWIVSWLRRGESHVDPLTLHTGVEVLTTLRRLDLRPGADDGNPLRASEPARTLALTLAYGRELDKVRAVLVVETRATDGARSVSVDLALALVEMGRSVALVEADFRLPMLAVALPVVPNPDVGPRVGLFDEAPKHVAKGWPDAAPMEIRVDGPGRLHLYAGAVSDRPLEALNRPASQAFLTGLRDEYDFVVVVSPGLLTFVDGLELMHLLDGALLVSDARDWYAPDLEQATAYVRRVGGTLVGAVRVMGSVRITA
jgi:succinoglycan biosynthesis transport protein ExoP